MQFILFVIQDIDSETCFVSTNTHKKTNEKSKTDGKRQNRQSRTAYANMLGFDAWC